MSSLRQRQQSQLDAAEHQLADGAAFIADLQARLSAATTEHTTEVFGLISETAEQPKLSSVSTEHIIQANGIINNTIEQSNNRAPSLLASARHDKPDPTAASGLQLIKATQTTLVSAPQDAPECVSNSALCQAVPSA